MNNLSSIYNTQCDFISIIFTSKQNRKPKMMQTDPFQTQYQYDFEFPLMAQVLDNCRSKGYVFGWTKTHKKVA